MYRKLAEVQEIPHFGGFELGHRTFATNRYTVKVNAKYLLSLVVLLLPR